MDRTKRSSQRLCDRRSSMLAVVSHDAGGAEILSSYVRQQSLSPLLVLEGPARKIFERKLGGVTATTLEDAIARCASVLTGTSWQSDLEFNAIHLARQAGKQSASFIDHWINYGERFTRGAITHRPDEIWVGDSIAEGIANRHFPATPVCVVPNPYFEDIRAELARLPRSRRGVCAGLDVLYVCEPLREHGLRQFGNERHFGYVEEDALRFFLANVGLLGHPVRRITIRPHPSEPCDKYEWAKREFSLPIASGGKRTLVEEVNDANAVVGCESMAMVVGLLAAKRVICCIPAGGNPCGLPHDGIEHLQRMFSQPAI
jgi:hypothetical protein